jgi:hypothetical protein
MFDFLYDLVRITYLSVSFLTSIEPQTAIAVMSFHFPSLIKMYFEHTVK